MICSLHRGLGGAIRRARTRLPGGGDNPVALIRIPRERMIGYGIASSLVHEVGHQGAALLQLVESLQARARVRSGSARACVRPGISGTAGSSEIVADFWSISRVGIGSTLGLIGLVSLPRGFVFRPSDDDPHPMPWVRVLLSCAIGDRLYPDPQWRRLAATWRAMYPIAGLRPQLRGHHRPSCATTMPDLVSVLVEHRPPRLRGWSLGEVLRNPELEPGGAARALRGLGGRSGADGLRAADPGLRRARSGQGERAALAGAREPLLRRLIGAWAVHSSLETARATTRSAPEMFVGQPTIWADAAHLTGGTNAMSHDHDETTDCHYRHRRPNRAAIAGGGIVVLTAELSPVRRGTYDVVWTVTGPARLSRHRTPGSRCWAPRLSTATR